MTLEEAKKLGRIATTADGGCISCCRGILNELNEHFPEYAWKLDKDKFYLDSDEAISVEAQKHDISNQ